MKTFIPSIIMLFGLALLAWPSPRPAPSLVEKLAARSPLCDCDDCACKAPCLCNVVDEQPKPTALVVGPPPDSLQVAAVAEVAETFTHPLPQVLPVAPPPKPQVLPVKPKAAPAPVAGHYEYRQQCGPGGCSMARVWVPHTTQAKQAAPVYQQYGSCGPGGCGVRRGLFGRRR